MCSVFVSGVRRRDDRRSAAIMVRGGCRSLGSGKIVGEKWSQGKFDHEDQLYSTQGSLFRWSL